MYVWEVEIDRTRVRVLREEDDTWQCVGTYGVGEGVDATLDSWLDWTALREAAEAWETALTHGA